MDIGLGGELMRPAGALIAGLYRAFDECDCSLAEINPLVVTKDGRLLAADAKLNFDDNALYRHKDLAAAARPRRGGPAGGARRRTRASATTSS